jgi:S-DNA-T family DNA segregation ATPase FtsK/SpoIIIE
VNSPLDLRSSKSLELLASLQQTAAAFAQREEQLTRDLATRRHTANRKFRIGIESAEAKLAALRAESDAALHSAQERLTALYEGRRSRVQRTSAAGLRKLPLRARQTKERWLGDLQMRHFQAERKLEADQKAADAALAEFNANLAQERTRFTALWRRARRSFAGYWTFQRALRQPHTAPPPATDRDALFSEFRDQLANAEVQFAAFLEHLLPRFFGYALPIIVIPLLLVTGFILAVSLQGSTAAMGVGGVALLLVVFVALHYFGYRQSKAAAFITAAALAKAGQLHDTCAATATAQHQRDRQRLQEDFQNTQSAIMEQWNRADEVEVEFEQAAREKIGTQTPRIMAQIDQFLHPKLATLASAHDAQQTQFQGEAEAHRQQATTAHAAETAALASEEVSRWDTLTADWHREIVPLYAVLAAINAAADAIFPQWSESFREAWSPPAHFTPATKFGQLEADLATYPRDSRLPLPGPARVSLPLALSYPYEGSLLFETKESAGPTVIGALNNIILRLLTTTPPGKVSFNIIDPVGLGQSFAGLMHLGDYEEALISRRIWTQREQIEERLADLSEHIEKVIQMYLRNEYASISEYNEKAGSVAEKYHFLVVADFPAGFSETSARRLQSIATSGARCGVFTLIHWDERQELPDGFAGDELRKSSIILRRSGGDFILANAPREAAGALIFDPPPAPDLAVQFVHKIGKASIDSNRVEVPFSQIAPAAGELWTSDTTNELKVAIGRTGATKHQYLAIGKGTRQHALFAGKTGSGKSTLFHVIITNLALAYSPEQVEFYLIDFKKGVEFKCYAEKRLPHARVVAIESDREFALSVLQRVDEELKRRGDIFRKLGVQDIPGYKRAGGSDPMPRSLLIIDEFQEFFVDDDTIAQTASLLFDRIVRQGRAFGIHVLLGSQTLGGAYSLARATLGQMVIRVALQCNEADAYLIMDENNSAPRLLSRPGEGIYNDAAGAVEGNSPFQVVWLGDDERDQWLDKVNALAMQKDGHHPSPIVFEGNAPADLRENDYLQAALAHAPASAPGAARAWFGAPNSIKGPTEAVFQQQSGNHLLIVGQRDEAALNLLGISMLSLAAQYPRGTARFVLIQSTTPGSSDAEQLDRIIAAIPHDVTVTRGPEIPQMMTDLSADLKARASGEAPADPPTVFVFIHGLHRFKKLRQEDDFSFSMSGEDAGASAAAQFQEIIIEGSSVGLHLIVSIDTYNNVNRSMSRKALSEFEMRVVFQMSANDSASLIDSPKASNLGLHRALFYNEQSGTLETFRPYAAPDRRWLQQMAEALASHGGRNTAAPAPVPRATELGLPS